MEFYHSTFYLDEFAHPVPNGVQFRRECHEYLVTHYKIRWAPKGANALSGIGE